MRERPYVIAEAGSCHDGDFNRAIGGCALQDETRLIALGPLPFLSGSTSNVMRCPSVNPFHPARSTAVM